jgi:hypothetical protein
MHVYSIFIYVEYYNYAMSEDEIIVYFLNKRINLYLSQGIKINFINQKCLKLRETYTVS